MLGLQKIECTLTAGTLTQNEMTVTKAWVGGKIIEDVKKKDRDVSGNGASHSLTSELSESVVSQLTKAIVLNCSASLQRQEDSGGDFPTPDQLQLI